MKPKASGFTAVEILIVVLIIGILAAIAIPGLIHARASSQAKTCVQNLWQIQQAKEEYAMAARLSDGALVNQADLTPDYMKDLPVCPSGGNYVVGPVNENPTCTIGGLHTLQGTGMNSNTGDANNSAQPN